MELGWPLGDRRGLAMVTGKDPTRWYVLMVTIACTFWCRTWCRTSQANSMTAEIAATAEPQSKRPETATLIAE